MKKLLITALFITYFSAPSRLFAQGCQKEIVSPVEYRADLQQLKILRQKTENLLKSLSDIEDDLDYAKYQEELYMSHILENISLSYFNDGNYTKANKVLNQAKNNVLETYIKTKPSSMVEARTLWLDRGTIVSVKTKEQMSELFSKIGNIGINIVYLETINAGFAIYPSKITEQNPLTKNKDPLKWAIDEAHKRNIQLHAWVWTFAVGNTRHNKIICKPENYKGPLLSKYPYLALKDYHGNLIQKKQHEYWLDPANPMSQKLLLSLFKEIVKNYDVDGIQLDYIRYPFQSPKSTVGYTIENVKKFKRYSGKNLLELKDKTIWNEWKSKQISKFVRTVSYELRALKPNIKISAAVFVNSREKRIKSIQQDWQAWIDNGWIDILNPMIYSCDTTKLIKDLEYLNKTVLGKVLIYPGIAVKNLNDVDILNQIDTIKDMGLIGNTLFAMAHLTPQKSKILALGPYKNKNVLIPNENINNSVDLILKEYIQKLTILKKNSKYTFNVNRLINYAKFIKYHISYTNKPSVSKVDYYITLIRRLELLTSSHLPLEIKSDRILVDLLCSYLKQANLLLLYEKHKLNVNRK